jgi:hypothetical protein
VLRHQMIGPDRGIAELWLTGLNRLGKHRHFH